MIKMGSREEKKPAGVQRRQKIPRGEQIRVKGINSARQAGRGEIEA